MICPTKINKIGVTQHTGNYQLQQKYERPKTSQKQTPNQYNKKQISLHTNQQNQSNSFQNQRKLNINQNSSDKIITLKSINQLTNDTKQSENEQNVTPRLCSLENSLDQSQNMLKICEDPKIVRIKFKTTLANGDLKKNNWEKVQPKQNCDIFWINYITEEIALQYCRSRISRIPGMRELSNKKQTSYYLRKSAEYFPGQFYFYPKTYVMPEDFTEFYKTFINNPKKLYIAKPDKGTQGAGIFLLKEISQLFYNECLDMKFCKNFLILQEYIQNPLLLNQKKFDLRLYVLITSLKPFIIYLNEEGLARFCTENYHRPNSKNANNQYMHLTNYHLNKNSSKFIPQTKDFQNENTATKRTYTSLLKSLQQMDLNIDRMKKKIEVIILRFLYSMLPRLLYNYREVFQENWESAKCFHILGFDILLDNNLKPYILEVNASPSLDIVQEVIDDNGKKKIIQQNEISQLDLYVKQRVVEDAVLLAMKEPAEQIQLIGKGKYFNSYKMIADGKAPEQNIDIFEKMNYLYGSLCGRKFGPLSGMKFQKMATHLDLVNKGLLISDYDLIYKKVINQEKTTEMDFKLFIDAFELAAEKYYSVQKIDVCLLTKFVNKALENISKNQFAFNGQ